MKQGPHKATWNDEVEQLLQSWLRRVAAAETGHRLMADRLKRRYLLLGVPVVVFTTIVGTSVFASLQAARVSTSVRLVVASISILAAMLSSLQTFLRYGMRSEGHRVAAVRYETLRRDVAKVLALPRSARIEPVRELDSVRQRMDRYAKESPTIGPRQWANLERRFHLAEVPPDPRWNGSPIGISDGETLEGTTPRPPRTVQGKG